MSYLNKDFLLNGEAAKKLYFEHAEKMPIFDYHCHLPEREILEDKEFGDMFEVWLGGDHYKWRLMRNAGVDESFITGDKPHKEKFKAYCATLGTAFGNPLYHWSQVELEEYFGCKLEINEKNADEIWEVCNAYIKEHRLSPVKLIERSNVKAIFTTNEIFDDLDVFREIKKKGYPFLVLPAFRADKIMNIEAEKYNDFLAKLGPIQDLDDLEEEIERRLIAFIEAGCVASDISLEGVYEIPSKEEAGKAFAKRRSGAMVSKEESETFKGYLTYFLLGLYGKHGIRSELHIGPMRNNNSLMLAKLGLDSGYDSIGESDGTKNLSRLMDRLNSEGLLPPMILFNLNPKMNLELISLAGCFQDGSLKGKIQYGPAWWFLDNKAGIERQLSDLASGGHLASFIGMLTDSRSFLSYPRHHYFRRILCSYLGSLIEKGELTSDLDLAGKVVEDISFNNAWAYFGLK